MKVINFILDNWELILPIILSVLARIIPTEKDLDWFSNLVKLFGKLIPNIRKKSVLDDVVEEGKNLVAVKRSRHIIPILLLCSFGVFGQTNGRFKSLALYNADSLTVKTEITGLSLMYDSVFAMYLNAQASPAKLRCYTPSRGWYDCPGNGGGGGGGGGITNTSPINSLPVTIDGSGNLGTQTNVNIATQPGSIHTTVNDYLLNSVVNGTDSAYIGIYNVSPFLGGRAIHMGVLNSYGVPISQIRIGGGDSFLNTNDGTTFSVVNASSGSASIYAFDATTQSQVQTFNNRIWNKVQSGSIISEVNQTTTSYTFGIGDNSDTTHFSFTPDSVNITSSGNMSINADSIFFNNVPVDTSQYVLTQRFSDGRIGRKKISSSGGPSFGTSGQIPYMNFLGTDFDYGRISYDGFKLNIGQAGANNRTEIDEGVINLLNRDGQIFGGNGIVGHDDGYKLTIMPGSGRSTTNGNGGDLDLWSGTQAVGGSGIAGSINLQTLGGVINLFGKGSSGSQIAENYLNVVSGALNANLHIVADQAGGISLENSLGATVSISSSNAGITFGGGSVYIDSSGELFISISRTSCSGAPSGSVAKVSNVLTVCP